MGDNFLEGTLGATGARVFRLGLSATRRPGERTVRYALDQGVNFVFGYGIDTQLSAVVRTFPASAREGLVIATGAYNFSFAPTNLKRALERRLKQFHTDYVDLFLFLGVMRPGQFGERLRDQLLELRAGGRVRAVGISTHDRKFAGSLAGAGTLDALMIRYNAAHRGAESEIFPFRQAHGTGIVSYTATCWGHLLKGRSGWPKGRAVPTAGDCYRFVLGNPAVDVCLTSPSNPEQLEENLKAVRQGPLEEEAARRIVELGDLVHRRAWYSQ